MAEHDSSKPPGPPWQREAVNQPDKPPPTDQPSTIDDLASALRKEVRDDQTRQADRRRRPR